MPRRCQHKNFTVPQCFTILNSLIFQYLEEKEEMQANQLSTIQAFNNKLTASLQSVEAHNEKIIKRSQEQEGKIHLLEKSISKQK